MVGPVDIDIEFTRLETQTSYMHRLAHRTRKTVLKLTKIVLCMKYRETLKSNGLTRSIDCQSGAVKNFVPPPRTTPDTENKYRCQCNK